MTGLDKIILEMSRLSEAGFPDEVWPVVFFSRCNLRCPYCLNPEIVEPKKDAKFIPVDEVLKQLDSWGEDCVLLSGGEPCSDLLSASAVIGMAEFFVSNGKRVGMATNGTYPDALGMLIERQLVSFVALDCKFSPMASNPEAIVKKASIIAGPSGPVEIALRLQTSLETLQQWHEHDPATRSEVRTTMYPPLVGEQDVREIAELVHPRSQFVLQQYRQNIMFDGTKNPVEPYGEDEVARLFAVARENCGAKVSMRWP